MQPQLQITPNSKIGLKIKKELRLWTRNKIQDLDKIRSYTIHTRRRTKDHYYHGRLHDGQGSFSLQCPLRLTKSKCVKGRWVITTLEGEIPYTP